MRSTASSLFRAACVLFFGSGACGLVYETVWIRQLTLSFGISVYAISSVLTAFMFGLCLGSLWMGRYARRIRNPLRVYAWFELAIAVYALAANRALGYLLPFLLQTAHGLLPTQPLALNLVRFGLSFLILAIPTTLMGATLPLLGRLITREGKAAGAQLALLYGLNTLGGVFGTALAGFWLLKDIGVLFTTIVAAASGALISLAALLLSRQAFPGARSGELPDNIDRLPAGAAPASGLMHLVVFLSGYAALSYELMWNRSLLLYIHNSTYAFSMILIVFLLGVALGSLAYGRLLARWAGLRALGAVQLAIAAYVGWSVDLTGRLPRIIERVTTLMGTASWPSALATLAAATLVVVFIPTFLMGMTFPMAAALCSPGREKTPARIGSLYALTTLGNILGSLVTGFLLIERIGLRNSFMVALAFNLLAGFVLLFYRPGSIWRWSAGFAGAGLTLPLFITTIPREVFRSYYEAKYPNIIFYKEEIGDTVMVVEGKRGGRIIRYSDGRGTAGTGTEYANRLYGHIPMLLHRNPRSVLSICFGVGNTLSAIAQYRVEKLVAVELSRGVLEAAAYFPSNRNVLATPNLRVEIEDGRNFLLTTGERFDVIQLEPPEIHTATVVNLYTREFYELARRRLTNDGIICQWLNVIIMPEREMKMLIRTFVDAFPESSLWAGGGSWDLLLIGSPKPIRLDPGQLWARYSRPRVREDLQRIGLRSPQALLSYHVLGREALSVYVRGVSSISDDRTYVDFSVPRSSEAGFGVFLYQTHLRVRAARPRERVIDRLRLLARRESPVELIENRSTDPAQLQGFLETLDSEVGRRTAESRDELARLVGSAGD
jgi:spermidine synthase